MENTINNKCPKCGGEMEEGVELYPAFGAYAPKYWVKNLKQTKFLGQGMNTFEIKDGVVVKARKCVNCGFLESYVK